MNQLLKYGLSINEFMSTNCCKLKVGFLHILTFEFFLCRGQSGDEVGELTFHYLLRIPDPAIKYQWKPCKCHFFLGPCYQGDIVQVQNSGA